MALSNNKGLFVDFSEFSLLAARTTGFQLPMQIDEVQELPLDGQQKVTDFIRQFYDFKGGNYAIARCSVYPKDRFIISHLIDAPAKVKDSAYVAEFLQKEYSIDVAANLVAVLNGTDGADYTYANSLSKNMLLCGASNAEMLRCQQELLDFGLYPERLEISTLSTLGGVSNYTLFTKQTSPTLCLELTADRTNLFVLNKGAVEASRAVTFGLDSICPLLQRELGLKDENSARKLFFSNTFDFAEMGPKLLRRIIKELQATIGFYEVQTGQSVERLFVGVLPKNLAWISRVIAEALGVEILKPNFESWLEHMGVKLSDSVEVANLGARWFGLFSLMGDFHARGNKESEQEKQLSA